MTPPGTTSTTRVDEIAEGIFRISTPIDVIPGGFTFNQYLIADDEPLLFHTGMRALFPAVRAAIERVLPIQNLRWVACSHHEPDECGSLNDFLAAAPRATALTGQIGAVVTIGGEAIRPPRSLADGETLRLGRRVVEWYDAPHVPHGWDCGFLGERTTRTLFFGDLFTQPGAECEPITERDILGPSEAMRGAMDYFSHGPNTRAVLERLAATRPAVLACMHGSAWRGDGEHLLLELAQRLEATSRARGKS